ncbi:hypothetical protein EXU57_01265 [Segetibacter sp. 3557_3]|uniref:ligand-binding sensor domain-containing protein n=1 Tax=Segetibacter sp. 3557_3 TaxID=2547429 RepID=UPI00105872FF|nr:two-component regulator propeller domain-containing protein [Segetibacter sp. 3557_3]TDH28732.1 hypothetical protein EXU57_01265 [Segetibacter sp. 3557_3]
MKRYLGQIRRLLLLTITISCCSCNGQTTKDLRKESVSEPKTQAVEPPKIGRTKGNNVSGSVQDKAGDLWFGTGDGLYKYEGKSFRQFTIDSGLNSNKITSLLEDRSGKIWIGTEAGLNVFDGNTFATVQIPLRKDMPPNSQRNTHNVFSIMQDKSGKLWFATIDGVYTYDGKTFLPFIIKKDGPGFMSSNHNVESILEDKAGNIWFGGRATDGVYRYDGKAITNLKISEQKDLTWAWPALQDKKGNIWFTNWAGAHRYDGKSLIKMDGLSTNPLNPITRMLEDRKGNLWFGGAGGLWSYDGKSVTHFTVQDRVIDSGTWLSREAGKSNGVWSMLEDKTGNLWIGTSNTGLYRFDGKSFISFSEEK